MGGDRYPRPRQLAHASPIPVHDSVGGRACRVPSCARHTIGGSRRPHVRALCWADSVRTLLVLCTWCAEPA